jgi:hypothetical protein
LRRFAPSREGFNLRYSKIFKKSLTIPVVNVGGFIHREAMERAIANGESDLISVARVMIPDPFLFLYGPCNREPPGPQCGFCNACYACGAVWPIDCCNEDRLASGRRDSYDEFIWRIAGCLPWGDVDAERGS